MNDRIDLDNYEGYLMRYADGLLDDEERQAVDTFLCQHPDLRSEMEAVCAIRVTPVVSTMPNKADLMHKAVLPLWIRPAAVASLGVVLLVGTALFVSQNQSDSPIEVAAVGVDNAHIVADDVVATESPILTPHDNSIRTDLPRTKTHAASAIADYRAPAEAEEVVESALLADEIEVLPQADEPRAEPAEQQLEEPTESGVGEQSPTTTVKVIEEVVVKNAHLAKSMREVFLAEIM